MANPQLENGFTKISDELFDALIKWHLSSYEQSVFWFILRKTYGWNKKKDWISISQFEASLGMSQSHVCRTIKLLAEQNIIKKEIINGIPYYSIQKNYERWIKLPKGKRSHHPIKGTGRNNNWRGQFEKGAVSKGAVSKGVKGAVSKGADTKDTITKDNNTPMKKNSFKYSDKNHSDSFEDEIDYDSQESIEDKKTTVSKSMKELVAWSVNRRGFPFVNVVKQYTAFTKARNGGINPLRLRERWLEMESEDFWKDKGFDWTNVVNSFDRKQ